MMLQKKVSYFTNFERSFLGTLSISGTMSVLGHKKVFSLINFKIVNLMDLKKMKGKDERKKVLRKD